MFHRSSQYLRRCVAVACALSCFASVSFATGGGGVRLSWNHCAGEGTGAHNADFACDGNTGAHSMVGSFVLDAAFPSVVGLEVFVDLATASPSLPPWWALQPSGGCRSGSLSAGLAAEPTNVVCQDWSLGAAQGGLATYCTLAGPCIDHPANPNAALIKFISAVPPDGAQDLAGNAEYFAFSLSINHAHTAGPGSCAGCGIPACIGLRHINVVQAGALEQRLLTLPYEPGGNTISWQGGAGLTVGPGLHCPAVTASRASTWGAVKSLYR